MTTKTAPDFAQKTGGRKALDDACSEKDFMQVVIQLAQLSGYLVYHTYDSRRSASGFPDIVAVRGSQILYLELKRESGKLSTAQETWRDAIVQTGARWYLWRPSDFDEIVRVLSVL